MLLTRSSTLLIVLHFISQNFELSSWKIFLYTKKSESNERRPIGSTEKCTILFVLDVQHHGQRPVQFILAYLVRTYEKDKSYRDCIGVINEGCCDSTLHIQ